MAKAFKISGIMTMDTRSFQTAISGVSKQVSSFSRDAAKSLKSTGRQFASIGTDLGLLTAGLAYGLKTALGLAGRQANAERQLATVIKSTGAAAGVTADEVKRMASGLQEVTTFGDEAIIEGQNLLLTFTKIGKDVFPEATETMLNMSQALGQDLKSSAIQLGKALNDPRTGLTALRRVGVSFTKDQEDMVKQMVESGHLMQAQKVILKELATEFGGSARAAAQGFGGQMKQLKNAWGDFLELVGAAAVPALKDLVGKIKPIVMGLQEWFKNHQELASGIMRLVTNVVLVNGVASVLFLTFGKLFNVMGTGLGITKGLTGWIANVTKVQKAANDAAVIKNATTKAGIEAELAESGMVKDSTGAWTLNTKAINDNTAAKRINAGAGAGGKGGSATGAAVVGAIGGIGTSAVMGGLMGYGIGGKRGAIIGATGLGLWTAAELHPLTKAAKWAGLAGAAAGYGMYGAGWANEGTIGGAVLGGIGRKYADWQASRNSGDNGILGDRTRQLMEKQNQLMEQQNSTLKQIANNTRGPGGVSLMPGFAH